MAILERCGKSQRHLRIVIQCICYRLDDQINLENILDLLDPREPNLSGHELALRAILRKIDVEISANRNCSCALIYFFLSRKDSCGRIKHEMDISAV